MNDHAPGSSVQRQFGNPTHRIAHISDTQFVHEGRMRGQIDCEGHLNALFQALDASGRRPDALVFTGDLADAGEESAYLRLRALVEPIAAAWDSEVVWVMGNHDAREPFREHLLRVQPSSAPVDFVLTMAGLRLIVVDTSVPGFHHGDLSADQLEWLEGELADTAPDGTIIAMHHPPIPTTMELLEVYELKGQDRFARVVAGKDVRAILAGHFHYSSFSTVAGIPVAVASATCYTQDLVAPGGGVRGVDGGRAFNLVDVYQDAVVHSVVPLDVPTTLYEKPRDEALRQMAEVDGARRVAFPVP